MPFQAKLLQWRSQDIADARGQHGHTMFVRNSEVKKHLGESEACMLFQNIFGVLQPPTSVLRPYHSAVHVTYTANVTRNSVDKHSDTVPFDLKTG